MRKEVIICKYIRGKGFAETPDLLAEEKPVTIYINDLELVTLQCSPANLDELAVGYLVSEGIISPVEKVDLIIDEERGIVQVSAVGLASLNIGSLGKRTVTSGCGRGSSFYNLNDRRGLQELSDTSRFDMSSLLEEMQKLQARSTIFLETGGVHSAALQLPDIVIFREDVARHNAVDKIMGYCALHNLKTAGSVLYLSGRISSEIVLKAARLKIPLVISRSAPTTLAVSLGQQLGVTIIGFARGPRANIYTHRERVE